MSSSQQPSSLAESAPRCSLRPAVGVFFAIAILCGILMREFGVSTDEPAYIRDTQRVQQWFADFSETGFTGNLSEDRLQTGWPFAQAENRNMPLVSVVSLIGYATVGHFDTFPAQFRWGNVLVFAATGAVAFHWIRVRYSASAAVVMLAALLGNPRLFVHAQLMSVDTLIGCLWLLASLALSGSRDNWRRAALFAVLAGVGLTSKATFWFAVPAWILWGLCQHPKELWRAAVCLATVTPLTAYGLSPMWWSSPIDGCTGYLMALTSGTWTWHIGTYYLGDIYQTESTGPVPWHSVIVLTAVTTPIWILVLGAVGTIRSLRCWRDTSDDGLLWLVCGVTLPLLCMLPNTPCHDGPRQYRTLFFFLPLLAASGFEVLRLSFLTRTSCDTTSRRVRLEAAVVAVVIGITVWPVIRMHPGQLSYYNAFAGGLSGASEPVQVSRSLPEQNRPLFEVAYWWTVLNDEAIDEIQSHLHEGATLWVHPNAPGLTLHQQRGRFREDIRFVRPSDRPEYALLYGKLGVLADPLSRPAATVFLHRPAVWEKRIDGVRIVALFDARKLRGGRP